MEPLALNDPNPEAFQLCNELRRLPVAQVRYAFEVLRKSDPVSYQYFVVALRVKDKSKDGSSL